MSEQDDFDPDAGVPLWVNVLVPTVSGLLFIAVLVILSHTKKEVPLETIEDLVEKIPIINGYLSSESECQSEDETTTKTKSTEKMKSHFNERSKIRKSLSLSDIRKYDSISGVTIYDNTM